MSRRLRLLTAVTAANGVPVRTKAYGEITTVAVANLLDGETFGIPSHAGGGQPGRVLTFEFNVSGTHTVTTGNYEVDVSGDTTDDDVKDTIIAAVNACAEAGVTASDGGAATVALTADWPGAQWNLGVLGDTVADAGFGWTSGLASGDLDGVSLADWKDVRAATLRIWSTAGSNTMTTLYAKLWLYDAVLDRWFPEGAGATDAARGLLNNGQPIGENLTDEITFQCEVAGVFQADRVYLELGTFGGTGTALSAELVVEERVQ